MRLMTGSQATPNPALAGKRDIRNHCHTPLMLDQAMLAVGARNIISSTVVRTLRDFSPQPSDHDVLSLVTN